jgi:hypothetical protein
VKSVRRREGTMPWIQAMIEVIKVLNISIELFSS